MIHHQVPVGTVLPYAGPVAEAGGRKQIETNLARAGWLFCDGRLLHGQEYPALHGVIGAAFGGDDGAKTFNLPDLRGRFLRGVDVQSGDGDPRDPDAGARGPSADGGNAENKVGSVQADAFQGHEHQYTAVTQTGAAQGGEGPPIYSPGPEQPTTGDVADTKTRPSYGTPRVSSETRPTNIYLNFIIRYR